MKKLYVTAGCNGAGKTTASFTILPQILDCKEFVNADEIARGLFNKSGLKNFFTLFLTVVDNWLFVNNSGDNYEVIAERALNEESIHNSQK